MLIALKVGATGTIGTNDWLPLVAGLIGVAAVVVLVGLLILQARRKREHRMD